MFGYDAEDLGFDVVGEELGDVREIGDDMVKVFGDSWDPGPWASSIDPNQ